VWQQQKATLCRADSYGSGSDPPTLQRPVLVKVDWRRQVPPTPAHFNLATLVTLATSGHATKNKLKGGPRWHF